MHKFFLIGVGLLAANLVQAQTPAPLANPPVSAPPAASAVPAPAATPAPPATGDAEAVPEPEGLPDANAPKPAPYRLLDTGGFEVPRVNGRTPQEAGGNPVMKVGKREWIYFKHTPPGPSGKLTAGLTNEIARSGKQSLYVQFDKVTASNAKVDLSSDLISILPNTPYHVGIWGRIDKKNPLALDQRLPMLRLQVDFFQADKETQADESLLRTQPIPGSLNRPLLFTSARWAEFFSNVTSPADAAYVKITWTVATPAGDGEINGIIYFDDATILGQPGKTPQEIADETPEPASEPSDTAAPAADPAPATPAPAMPAPPTPKPKPAKKK